MTPHTHQTHPDIIKRLNRARGHLQSVTTMIEDGRPCLDIAQQLHAVEKAIQQAKKRWCKTISITAWKRR
jgi:DNA-binding FrmR family transcriptional regulator